MDPTLPLPQSPEFARTAARLGRPVLRLDAPGLVCQAQVRRIGPLAVTLVSRGPVASDPAALAGWLGERLRGALVLNADGIAPDTLRAAGFWPLMTPATLGLLPLREADAMRAAMAQKWRNRLNRAEAAGLRVTRRGLQPGHWVLRAEAGQAQRRGYRGMPPGFAAAFAAANPGCAQVFEARHDGTPVATALVLVHGRMATWQIGVCLTEGRRRCAMNLVLWSAMTHLAEAGVAVLDLGILNAQDAPGLVHFKLGTGAVPHRLGGTWARIPGLGPLARHLPLGLAG